LLSGWPACAAAQMATEASSSPVAEFNFDRVTALALPCGAPVAAQVKAGL
jgi:hypothetical protein